MDNEKEIEKKGNMVTENSKEYAPRQKILVLRDIFYENADETHGITMKEIQSKLQVACGVKANKKTVYTDIDVLQDYGMRIHRPKGRAVEYRLEKKEDELNYVEVKMLIDTVQSSRFLTKKQADKIISKLERLCSKHERKTLNHKVIIANRAKSDNYHILQNMDEIHRAIESNKQIRFQYYGFDMYKQKEYHHFGNEYRVSPFALIYHQGLYTLIAIPARDTRIRFYRIDRMENVVVSRADRLHEEIFNEIDIDRFTSGTFGLHASEVRDVTLKCHKSLVDTIMDRFGADVPFTIVDEKHFEVTVPVVMNADFYGWIFSLGGRIVIMAPEKVRYRFENACRMIRRDYRWIASWARNHETFMD